ncbi:MAG: ATP-binding protein, partial [Actinobacteria bacterium]|nr:ATP-binding protein [Actinomycetota bacterium]
ILLIRSKVSGFRLRRNGLAAHWNDNVFQIFLLVEVGAGRSESVPRWFYAAAESFAGVAGICIVYLSVELSRIRQVRYPLIVAVAFGASAIVSGVIVIGTAEDSVMHQFIASWSINLSDIFRLGQYVLVVPLTFLPFALDRDEHRLDRADNVLLALTAVLVAVASVLEAVDLLVSPGGQNPTAGGNQEPFAKWFSEVLTALCVVGTLSNLRLHRETGNRLLLGAAVLVAVIGLGQMTRSLSIPPNWLWIYFNRLTRLAGYTVFGLILLGEYIRGYRGSVALTRRANYELERKVEYLKMLTESTRLLSAALDVNRVQGAVVDAAVRLLNGSAAILLVYDEASGLLEPRCIKGNPNVFPRCGFPPSRGIAGSVFLSQKAEFVPDIAKDPRAIVRDIGPEVGSISLLSVPLLIREKAIGALNVVSPSLGVEHPPSPEQIELLTALASQAAVALENARLFERTALMHEQLRLAGLRLEAIIDSMPEGVCIAEAPSGRIILANSAAERIVGHSPLVGVSVEDRPKVHHILKDNGDLFPYQELPTYRSIHNREICRGVEMDLASSPNKKITVLANSAPIEDTQGNVVGAVAVFQDITRQKQAERMKDDFLSLVSHDLKTPLTTIKGYASTLIQDDVDWSEEEQKRFLRVIGQEADRLTRRVQDLLDGSSIASGNLRINKSWCDARDLIEVTIERLGDLLGERQVQVDIPEDLPPLPVDATRFKQVLSNLLDNAVKFSNQDSKITIRACPAAGAVLVSVSDCGIGIEPDNLPKVFARFSQVHDPAVRGSSGKGLGLAICQGIVEAHGGTIWVDSSVGKGSTFTVSLPTVGWEIIPDA